MPASQEGGQSAAAVAFTHTHSTPLAPSTPFTLPSPPPFDSLHPLHPPTAFRPKLVEVKRLKDEARVAHQKKLAEVAVISTGREGDYVQGKGETGGHSGFADKDAK